MPSSHTITTRPATEDELLALSVRAESHPILNGCLISAVCALPVALLFSLIIGFGTYSTSSALQSLIKLGAIALTSWLAYTVIKSTAKERSGPLAIARAELEAGVVEEIEVSTERALLYHPYDGIDVGLAIEIAPDRTLLLAGGVTMDASVFTGDIEWPDDLRLPEGLRTEAPFPTTHFTLVRAPKSGYVFSIKAGTEFLTPDVHEIPGLITTDKESRIVPLGIDALTAEHDAR